MEVWVVKRWREQGGKVEKFKDGKKERMVGYLVQELKDSKDGSLGS